MAPSMHSSKRHLGGGNSNMCYFQPYLGFHDPIWRLHIFQMGWFNHQLCRTLKVAIAHGVTWAASSRKDWWIIGESNPNWVSRLGGFTNIYLYLIDPMFHRIVLILVGGNSNIFRFSPGSLGKCSLTLGGICFKWIESTTKASYCQWWHGVFFVSANLFGFALLVFF